jgi:uncharacterized protein (TIGR00288 family)
MFLIDADNVSVDVMEQGLRLLLNQHGAVHVRRAYCTAESAVQNQAFFKRMGIKPMVNLAAGKNSTDIAMAVDAIDLVLAERPDVVVIASSDSDFAPLVHRLREKGCVVRGIGQQGKTGDETQEVYDDYTVLEHRKAAPRADAPTRPARKTAARKTATAKSPAARKTPARKTAAAKTEETIEAPAKVARKTPARKRAAAGALPPEMPPQAVATSAPAAQEAPVAVALAPESAQAAPAAAGPRTRRGGRGGVRTEDSGEARNESRNAPRNERPRAAPLQAVLDCLPELAAGQNLALNVAVQRLREAQLLGKNSSSLKLFSQLSDRFELVPPGKPSQVRWRA